MKNYEIHVQNWKNGPLNHDYNLQVDDNVASVTRSEDSGWTDEAKGQPVGQLIDTGSGVVVTLPDEKVIQLDYSEAYVLQLLLLANLQKEYKTEIRVAQPVMSFSGLS